MLFTLLCFAVALIALSRLFVAEATYRRDAGMVDHIASGAVTAGEVLQHADGRAMVAVTDIADTAIGSCRTEGHHDFAAATGTTFSVGDIAWWDVSASLAIADSSADKATDFPLGPVIVAKVSGTLEVRVDMNGSSSAAEVNALALEDGADISTGTTTGTKIATATSQKLGFWNVTPVIQPAAAAQGAIAATLTDSTGLSGTHDDTLAAVTTFTPSVAWNGSSVYPSSADATAIATAITTLNQNASDTAQKIIELVTLVNALRLALVNSGIAKGGA